MSLFIIRIFKDIRDYIKYLNMNNNVAAIFIFITLIFSAKLKLKFDH